MDINFKNKIEEIRSLIENSKKPIMFFDVDTDGSTSYLQLKRVFKKLVGFPMDKDFRRQKSLLDNYLTSKHDLVIIFDIPFLTADFLDLISNRKIIWADHHPTNDLDMINKYSIVHLNPLNYDVNDNRPSCFLSYLIANDLNNLDLVSLGIVSDFFLFDLIYDFYNFDRASFKLIFKLSSEKRDEIFDFINRYKFNDKRVRVKREDYIRFLSYESGVSILKNFFDFICKFEKYGDTIRAFRLIEKLSFQDLVSEISAAKSFPFLEYDEIMSEYRKRLKIVLKMHEEDFSFYEYVGSQSFAKPLSEELNYRFKNSRVVGVCFKKPGKDWYSCSFRGKGIVVNDTVSKSLSDLNGRGGGHPFAAGASVNKSDYNKFISRVKRGFDKLLKK